MSSDCQSADAAINNEYGDVESTQCEIPLTFLQFVSDDWLLAVCNQ